MPVKVTLLFQQTTGTGGTSSLPQRIAGWSESWYYPGTSIPNAFRDTVQTPNQNATGVSLCNARANMLPASGSIIGQRFQVVAPTGPSQSTGVAFSGFGGVEADPPANALMIRVPALNANNIRRVALRGIPDQNVFQGEFRTDPNFTAYLQNFFQTLSGWMFQGRDLSQTRIPILTISALGVVRTVSPHTFNVGDMLRVLKTKTVDGDIIGGRFQVATIGPSNLDLTLANWPGEATSGGNLRKDAVVFVNVDPNNITIVRLITKKVGRPFAVFRGRRSPKRL